LADDVTLLTGICIFFRIDGVKIMRMEFEYTLKRPTHTGYKAHAL
jgi:predicted alpha/beta-hydrolase family hydrolase